MNLKALLPGQNDRAVFIGQTGCGKTTLAKYALQNRKFVVIYDAKDTIHWPGYHRVTDPAQLFEIKGELVAKHPKIIYAPGIEYDEDFDSIDKFFYWCYARGHCTVYVDEVYGVTPSALKMTKYHRACLTRGRERGLSTFSATQRPSNVPLPIFSESEHYYVFTLNQAVDRERVQRNTAIEAEQIDALGEHQFLYAQLKTKRIVGPLKLQMGA